METFLLFVSVVFAFPVTLAIGFKALVVLWITFSGFFVTGFVLMTEGFSFLVTVSATVGEVWFGACCCVDGGFFSQIGSVVFS